MFTQSFFIARCSISVLDIYDPEFEGDRGGGFKPALLEHSESLNDSTLT
jgi:hypothetical protein